MTDPVEDWQFARQALKYWTEQERVLRDQLVEANFKNASDGTHYAPLGNGMQFKLARSTKITVTQGDLLNKAVHDLRSAPATASLPDTLFRWKPELVTRAYKDASGEVQRIIAPALTSKPNAPQLEIVPVK